MKKKIIEALQTKFPGVEARLLDSLADNLAKKVEKEEDIATLIEGVTFQQVMESYADFRAGQASETARKNAVSDYEKKYGLKDGQKTSGGEPDKKDEPNKKDDSGKQNEPEWVKKLNERLDRIEKQKADEDEAKVQAGYQSKLVELLKEKEVRESFYMPVITGRKFKDEDEVTAFAESVAKSFADDEQSVANSRHDGSRHPDRSDTGDGEDALLKGVETRTAEIAKEKSNK